MKLGGPLLLLLVPAAAWGQIDDASHRKVYEKAADSVVGIRALAPLGERSGTGTIVDAGGFILTSYSVCPEGSRNIRIWGHGPKKYEAEIVGCSKRDELTLLRIQPQGELKPVEFGESGRVRVGEIAYTIGNAANSIILDDQPSLNVGLISGMYKLPEPRASATYTGMVFETTAAVNIGMEGAPLLDASGRMIGCVTLNYSPQRFLGAAIPIDGQRYVVALMKEGKHPSQTGKTETPEEPEAEGAIGFKVKAEGGRVVIAEVQAGGAAERAGLVPGIALLAIGEAKIATPEDLWGRLKEMKAGSIIWLKVEDAGDTLTVKVELGRK